VEPDEILWENMAFTKSDSDVRKQLVRLAAIFVSLVSGSVVMLLDWERSQAVKRNPVLECPNQTLTAEEAYYDVTAYKPYGVMQCFCEELRRKGGIAHANSFSFKEYSHHGEDETLYCLEEGASQLYTTAVVATSAVSIVAFNGIIARVF